VVVGVIDTGIDGTHPDLAANLWVNPNTGMGGYENDIHGYNFAEKTGGIPTDRNGHGTHAAGIIGAKGNNGQGISGINWNVSLAWLGAGSGTNSVSMSACIEALNYANLHGIPITNNSYGTDRYSRLFYEAILNYDGLFVAAAGNDGNNNDIRPEYPACYDCPNIISVASTDENDNLSTFSNYGDGTTDIAAPGSNIWSTYTFGGYTSMSGTSMSGPYVAGTAALVKALYPTYTTEQLKTLLLESARPAYGLSYRILDAGRALRYPINGFVPEADGWYYYINGEKQTGYLLADYFWRYLDPAEGGRLAYGWKPVDGVLRYFAEGGIMLYGWHTVEEQERFFGEGSVPLEGFHVVDGAWRYFYQYGIPATRGCYEVEGYLRFFGERGEMYPPGLYHMESGWRYISEGSIAGPAEWRELGGLLRYLADGGLLLPPGWYEIEGHLRYIKEGSIPASGLEYVDGRWITFDGYGVPLE
jgi:hypothetical protein